MKMDHDKETMKAEIGIFLSLLSASGKLKDLGKGSKVHADLLKRGMLETSTLLPDALAIMYAKCGALTKAQELICGLSIESLFPWTAVITGYVQHGQAQSALACYERFRQRGVPPDAVMFACILRACGSTGAIDKGEQIHNELAKENFLCNDVVLGTALVDMYAKCGVLVKAREVLDGLQNRDVVAWSALIAGYVQQGEVANASSCFEQMQCEGLSPNPVTATCMLRGYGIVKDIDRGEKIHHDLVREGWLRKDVILGNALVEMYVNCGELVRARQVLEELTLRNVVSWSTLITGFVEQNQGTEALRCFRDMQREGLCADAMIFACILKACGMIGALDQGEKLHDQIAGEGMLEGNLPLATALVDMYVKCDAFSKAQEVLKELRVRDIIAWNALIAGYAQRGLGQDALICFQQLEREGLIPDVVTFTCSLKACSSIGAADKGQEIHDEIVRRGLLQENMILVSALVDMYAKCGALSKAQSVLEELPVGDPVAWSALIIGHALQGHGEEAFKCFEQMQEKGIALDSVTFSSVLNACCHRGLVDEGEIFFAQMTSKYGIKPNLEHYVCMVTLLGHSGRLDKAVKIIHDILPSDYPVICSTLLGACRKWGDVDIGEWAFHYAIQLDKYDAAPYVHMANLYVDAGMQVHAEFVESLRLQRRASKDLPLEVY